ncbi:MAG: YqjF family protein [Planctomycetaceae bacterium]
MTQRWEHLLFLHWRFDRESIQSRLPAGLTADTYDGAAWLGVVPFFMRNIRIRGLPPIPTATNFLELNLRTYVHDDRGVPGVWFFSLDANSWLTVQGARSWFGLPYHHARIHTTVDDQSGEVDYHSRRRVCSADTASHFRYRASARPQPAEPGTPEFFLVERYLLFSANNRGQLSTGRVWHDPSQIAPAEVSSWDDHLLRINGFPSPGRPPDHAVVSPGVSVNVFPLVPQDAA